MGAMSFNNTPKRIFEERELGPAQFRYGLAVSRARGVTGSRC